MSFCKVAAFFQFFFSPPNVVITLNNVHQLLRLVEEKKKATRCDQSRRLLPPTVTVARTGSHISEEAHVSCGAAVKATVQLHNVSWLETTKVCICYILAALLAVLALAVL